MNIRHKKASEDLEEGEWYVIPELDDREISLKVQNRSTDELIKLGNRLEEQLVRLIREVVKKNIQEDWIKNDSADKENIYSFFLTQLQEEINYYLQREARGNFSVDLSYLQVEWDRLKALAKEQSDSIGPVTTQVV